MRVSALSRLTEAAIGVAALAFVTQTMAQTLSNAPAIHPAIECSAAAGGCAIYKYGLAAADSYTNGEPDPYDLLARDHDSFSGSYLYSRSSPAPGAPECGAERGFVPVFGQVLIREEADCLPPPLGSGTCRACSAGSGNCAEGVACSSGFDCPGGLCSNLDAGCPVEIASDLGVPGEDIVLASSSMVVGSTPFGPFWAAFQMNSALVTDGPALFTPDKRLGIGHRFQRPGGGTQVFWVDVLDGVGNDGHGRNYGMQCCNDLVHRVLCYGQTQPVSPLSPIPDRASEGRNEAPWTYPDDDPATAKVEGNWELEPNYTIPGQAHGNCALDGRVSCSRAGALDPAACTGPGIPYSCCTGAGVGFCGGECQVTSGIDLGPCDLRERGWRFNRPFASLADGSPDPARCNATPYVLRGAFERWCSVITLYNECLAPHLEPPESCVVPAGRRIGNCTDSTPDDGWDSREIRCSPGPSPLPLTGDGLPRWGDPGPHCAVRNFGPQIRPDLDCDGIEDDTVDTDGDGLADAIGDSCPYYTEVLSVDPAAISGTAGSIRVYNTDGGMRADECECGDSNRDGELSVADLVDINLEIFAPTGEHRDADFAAPLSDANGDGRIDVSDIVALNVDLFSPQLRSHCGRSPVVGK